MKNNYIKLLLVLVFAFPIVTIAQEVKITKFEMNPTSRKASMTKVLDNNQDVCAVIRFWYSGSDFIIEPNLGVLRKEEYPGETRLWVPKGTKKITIRHLNDSPLREYIIPVQIESTIDYDAEVKIVDTPSNHHVYVGAGYNVVSISGPSAAIGFKFGGHNIELGAVYGLNKTDDVYYYNQSGNAIAGYNFSAIRAYLKYGYEIPLSDYFSLTPQAGLAYHAYSGKSVISSNDTDYKSASSMSLLAGLRLAVSITDNFKFCLTPEYDVAVYKGDNCKLVSSIDDTMKSWHTGFNLNVGIMVYF